MIFDHPDLRQALALIEELVRALGVADNSASEVNRQLIQRSSEFLATHQEHLD
jgi:hypothetical protein